MATLTRFPSSHTAVSNGGWTNPQNAYANGDVYATGAPARNNGLSGDFGGFGFDGLIPAGATINSVTVEIEWKASTTASILTLGAQAYVGSTAKGTELVNSAEPLTDTLQSFTVPGLTRADFAGAFAVRVRATRGNSTTNVTASIDLIRVTVDYTVPAKVDVSWAAFEVPVVAPPSVVQVSWAAFEAPVSSLPPADTTLPVLQRATVNGTTLKIFYDEPVTANVATLKDVLVTKTNGGGGVAVSSVTIAANVLTCVLPTAAVSTDTLTLTYSRSFITLADRIVDASGNLAAAFADIAVTNQTPVPPSVGSNIQRYTGTIFDDKPLKVRTTIWEGRGVLKRWNGTAWVAAAGSAPTAFTDSFNRANSTTTMGSTDTGQVWTPWGGTTWGIIDNRAYLVGGGAQAVTTIETNLSDGIVQVTKMVAGDAGLCFRLSDAGNYWVWNGSQLFKQVEGNFTSIGPAQTADAVGDVVTIVMEGSSISVRRNGELLFATTDTFNQTATKHGLRSNNDITIRFEDFSFGPLVSLNVIPARSAGFEVSDAPLVGAWTAWYGGTVDQSTTTANTGTRSLRFLAAGGNWGVIPGNYPGFAGATPGTRTIRMAGRKAGATISGAILNFIFRDEAGTTLASKALSVTLTSAWQTFSDTLVAPAGTTRVHVEMTGTGATAGDEAFFDDIYVG